MTTLTLFHCAGSLLALLNGLIGDGCSGLAIENLWIDPWILFRRASRALLDRRLTLLEIVFVLLLVVLAGAEAG